MTDKWMTSKDVAAFLSTRRDNDLKVNICNQLVPIADVYYHRRADTLVIDLIDGEDLRVAFCGLADLGVLEQFQMDALHGKDYRVTLECRNCEGILIEVEGPYGLRNLVQRAIDHAENCR